MHIITVMDYTDTRSTIMCKAWIHFAKRFNPHARITVFHTKHIDEIRSFASGYPSVHFRTLSIPRRVRGLSGGFTHHPVQELQMGIWAQTQQLGIHRYIYTDADALIVGSLDQWWKHIDDKPYIGIYERRLADGTILLNAGVYSYSDTKGFVTVEKLLEQYRRDNKTIRFPAGQQGLLTSYFQHIRYHAASPIIGHEYNTIARYCSVRQADDRDIIIYSGTYPFWKSPARWFMGEEREWSADWLWWNKPKRVKILHAFGVGFKFWELPECRPLWTYCQDIARR